MDFPNKVKFRLLDAKTKKAIPNLAVSLTLYAHRKNNYYVGPFISDGNGLVTFTKKDCLKEINSSQRFYLMDFSSNLDQCLPKVSIRIKPMKEIKYGIGECRRFAYLYSKYWNCSESYLKKLERCDNALYKPETFTFSEEELWKNKIIEIKVHRQPQKATSTPPKRK